MLYIIYVLNIVYVTYAYVDYTMYIIHMFVTLVNHKIKYKVKRNNITHVLSFITRTFLKDTDYVYIYQVPMWLTAHFPDLL